MAIKLFVHVLGYPIMNIKTATHASVSRTERIPVDGLFF